jgi:hypothetical protein
MHRLGAKSGCAFSQNPAVLGELAVARQPGPDRSPSPAHRIALLRVAGASADLFLRLTQESLNLGVGSTVGIRQAIRRDCQIAVGHPVAVALNSTDKFLRSEIRFVIVGPSDVRSLVLRQRGLESRPTIGCACRGKRPSVEGKTD